MKNVSIAYRNKIEDGADLYAYAEITLANGTELELTSEEDFIIDGNGYSESAGASSFPLGTAVAKTITLNIDNSDERFSQYDFWYARIVLYTQCELDDGTTESIKEGTFTVTSSVTPGDVIEIQGMNDMYKADIAYTPGVLFPCTLLQFVQDICSQCNILLGSPTFVNNSFIINNAPENITCRSGLGYAAQIAGGNAVMDNNNRLIIKTYDLSVFEQEESIISGHVFSEEVPDRISGGNFNETISNSVSGGDFTDNSGYLVLHNFTEDPEISTDDVVITGIATTFQKEGEEEETEYLYGQEGYVLSIDNPLIAGSEEAAIKLIGDRIIGITIRPFSGTLIAFPLGEFMDPVLVIDRKDNIYESFLTDIEYEYLSSTTVSNSTEPPQRANGEYYSQSTAAYRKAREDLNKQKTEWEKAMEDLSDRLDNSSGLYMTSEKQSDGSSIYYMHDKPTFEESKIVWKMTAEAMAVSSDGGKTWNAGVTVDGDTIVRILTAVGINADWINTGDMSADRIRGGTLILGGGSNGNGVLRIYNTPGSQIGYIDNTGVHFNQGTFSGSLAAATGTFQGSITIGGSSNGSIKIYDANGSLIGSWDKTGFQTIGDNFSVTKDGVAHAKNMMLSEDIRMSTKYYPVIGGGEEEYSMMAEVANYINGSGVRGYSLMIGFSLDPDIPTRILGINIGSLDSDTIQLNADVTYANDLRASGQKNRTVKTRNFDKRLLSCYEMTSPMFGDIGTAETDENGECIIAIDDILYETINSGIEYQVFLQKEGKGDIWVDSKQQTYFCVKGTPNMKFSWEIKAKQKDYEYNRLDADVPRDRAIGVENLLPTTVTKKLEEMLNETN